MRTINILLVALVLAGCGSSTGEDDAPATGAAVGPGLSVREAIATTAEGPLLVTGAVVASQGETRLCETLAESYPPQCGEPSLEVAGLDAGELKRVAPESDAEGRVRWGENARLLGRVSGRVLTIEANAQAGPEVSSASP